MGSLCTGFRLVNLGSALAWLLLMLLGPWVFLVSALIGAMEALAQAYLGGHGVQRDAREAARWAETAGQSQLPQLPGR